ncbi:hypothetical protein VTK26DRAFT_9043 [Humicola hyalothermophila]
MTQVTHPVQSIPPPSCTPGRWIWRCHECHSWYPLACTRRCLECSHEFCTSLTLPNSSSKGSSSSRRPSSSSSSSSSSSRRASKRRRQQTTCWAKFDYNGWAAWGAYRRETQAAAAARSRTSSQKDHSSSKRSKLEHESARPTSVDDDSFATWELVSRSSPPGLGHPQSQSASNTGGTDTGPSSAMWQPVDDAQYEDVIHRKEKMYLRGRHNCWLHCDYPSECLHTVRTAWERYRAGLDRAADEGAGG